MMYDVFEEYYRVAYGKNGIHALKELAAEENHDILLVCTDIVMPEMDGIELIKAIKKEYAHIPVIAMTGYGAKKVAEASKAKADAIFEKPFDVGDLHDKIVELIGE